MTSEAKLTDRAAAVLDAIVERYILTGEPVGSTAASRDLAERVSPATVRNVMAELERLGYLEQPHTSAGRQPTRRGYDRYVRYLLAEGRFQGVDENSLCERLQTTPIDVTELLQRTCNLLAELSHLVGVVLVPAFADTVFQHVDFVALERKRVLVIVVSRSGRVSDQIFQMIEPMSQELLDRASSYLVNRFAGRSLSEVARRLRELHIEASERLDHLDRHDDGDGVDEIQRHAIELGARAIAAEPGGYDVIVHGTAQLADQPGLERRHELRAVLEVIEERTQLSRVLSRSVGEAEPRVLIGGGLLPEELGGCALISASYRAGDRPLGSLAVLGPTRLAYAETIGLVRSMANATSVLFGRLRS